MGLESIHGRTTVGDRVGGGGGIGGLKTVLKNICEGVHLLVKLPAISLQILLIMTFFTHILNYFR